jgi:hypothetical protein
MKTVTAKCTVCGLTKEIKAGVEIWFNGQSIGTVTAEIKKGDMPMCDKCGSVMIAVKAVTRFKGGTNFWGGPVPKPE